MTSILKILFVHQGAEIYGSDRTLEQSIRAYRQAHPKSRITVLLPCTGPLISLLEPISDDIIINKKMFILRKATIKKQLKKPIYLIRNIYKARKFINNFDLTYINTIVVLDFIIATRFLKKPCILHIHEIPTIQQWLPLNLLVFFSRTFVVFNSEATKNSFKVVESRKNQIIINGTKIKNYDPIKEATPLKILILGRFNAWKGHHLLLKALSFFDTTQLNTIKVRMVGSVFENQDHFKESVVQATKQCNLSKIVSFFDFEKNTTRHYKWANLIIVPSIRPESFGLVAIEAMGHGRPVIGSDHGGLSSIIENGKTGYKFSPGNSKILNKVISKYLENPEFILQHGIQARKRFMSLYQEENYMKNTVKTIDSQLRSSN